MKKTKTVVISGASSGIGKTAAIKFARSGWNVGLLDINIKGMKATLRSLRHLAPRLKHMSASCDVSDSNDVSDAFERIAGCYGTIDALFANAGRHINGTALDTSEEDWDELIATNLRGVFLTVKHALPLLIANRGGAIVLCGSDQSCIGKRGNFAYGATKAAIAQMAKSLTLDFAHKGIRANCISPGTIDTPLVARAIANLAKKYSMSAAKVRDILANAQPIRRLGTPAEVAEVVYFLASKEASYVAGVNWLIDGGYTAQ